MLVYCFLLAAFYHGAATESRGMAEGPINDRPIIGILAQEVTSSGPEYDSYIAASYVKSVESAGARVVPVLIDQPEEYYVNLASSLNGFLFPGGSNSITNTSSYGANADLIYQLVLASQATASPLTLLAECLGFETLMYLAAGRVYPLIPCNAEDKADPLQLTEDWSSSLTFGTAPSDLLEAITTENITSNFHRKCVSPQDFTDFGLDEDYVILSTSFDYDGLEYVSTVEHRQFPIFGTQWHPEKATYEWKVSSIPHSENSIKLQQHLMHVFVQQARQNSNSFSSEEEETSHLIYNYAPTYSAELYGSSFQQCYYF